mmetsp:Transcript_51056/g.103804  ORF Transcript_51056/g.103804 Transcript_51056/m.103804 type:complete len:207 (-) Transcript_51056:1353-1973(-)
MLMSNPPSGFPQTGNFLAGAWGSALVPAPQTDPPPNIPIPNRFLRASDADCGSLESSAAFSLLSSSMDNLSHESSQGDPWERWLFSSSHVRSKSDGMAPCLGMNPSPNSMHSIPLPMSAPPLSASGVYSPGSTPCLGLLSALPHTEAFGRGASSFAVNVAVSFSHAEDISQLSGTSASLGSSSAALEPNVAPGCPSADFCWFDNRN